MNCSSPTFRILWISSTILASSSGPPIVMLVGCQGQKSASSLSRLSCMLMGSQSLVTVPMANRLLYYLSPSFGTSLTP